MGERYWGVVAGGVGAMNSGRGRQLPATRRAPALEAPGGGVYEFEFELGCSTVGVTQVVLSAVN